MVPDKHRKLKNSISHSMVCDRIFEDHFFVFKEIFSENSVLKYGKCLRAVCNQEQTIMVLLRYLESPIAYDLVKNKTVIFNVVKIIRYI